MDKTASVIEDFSEAIGRLKEALAQPKTELIRDAAIQRFEFSFDLCWKSLKAFLEEQKGVICRSPNDCFRSAYQLKVIEYDEFWLQLTKYRNLTVHTYNEKLAETVYTVLPEALQHFEVLLEKLRA